MSSFATPTAAEEVERFGRYVLVQEIVGEGNAARSNTYAVCEISHEEGATSYRLVSRGGFDPEFYGERIDKFGPPFESESLQQRPAGVHWWGLSGAFGGADAAASQKEYMDGRFGSGWDWRVLIERPEFIVTISSAERDVAVGDTISVSIDVANLGNETFHDVRLDGAIEVSGDGSAVVQSFNADIGTVEPNGHFSNSIHFTATSVGHVTFTAPQVSGQTDDGQTLSVTPTCDDGADRDWAPCTASGPTVEILPCEFDVELSPASTRVARLVGDAHPPAGGEYRPGDT
jgi:hypothetical protein